MPMISYFAGASKYNFTWLAAIGSLTSPTTNADPDAQAAKEIAIRKPMMFRGLANCSLPIRMKRGQIHYWLRSPSRTVNLSRFFIERLATTGDKHNLTDNDH